MTTDDAFESALLGAFGRLADGAPVDVDPVTMAAVATSGPSAAIPLQFDLRRRPSVAPGLLIGLAAMLMFLVVAGGALVGQRPPTIRGVFSDGPSIPAGGIVSAVTLPDGRVLIGIGPEEGTVNGTTTLRCNTPCSQHLGLLDLRTGETTKIRDQPPSLDLRSMALLPDGRVLILGRWPDGTDGPSAIYDPVSDRFEEVGGPLHARSWPIVATLADGRVLVAGSGAFAATAAELFDPSTGTFSSTGSMVRPRGPGASATRLRDGRILVVGGAEVGTAAELFDPATGTFSPTGAMTVSRVGSHSATLLPDGRVLVAGGVVPSVTIGTDRQTPWDATATAEVYDPTTGTFSAVGPMRSSRFLHAASVLADGTVLIVGGDLDARRGYPVPVADAEIFDPATDAFRPTGSLLRPRLLPAVVTADDRVLVLGDLDPTGTDVETGSTTEWFQ
jgi:hypothetical protein